MEDREIKKRYLLLPEKKDYTWFTMPSLTDDMVKAAEAELGKKLPQSYVDILRILNGGYLRYNCHPAPPSYTESKHIPILHLMGIGRRRPDFGGDGILDSPASSKVGGCPLK